PPRHRSRRLNFLRWLLPLAPALILMLVFYVGPILYAFYLGFTDYCLTGCATTNFTGLANFQQLFSDPNFWHSLLLTIWFLIFSALIGQAILGFVIALLLQGRSPIFRLVIGAIVIVAWTVPEIVGAYAWYTTLDTGGTLDILLGWLHLKNKIDLLYSLPMVSIIVANIWRGTAFSMLVFSAGLNGVQPDLLESAEMDGAGYWRRLRYVIIPLMRSAITTDLVLITLQTLGAFGLIYAMTTGGPGTSSTTLPIYIYQQAFQFYHLGYGTAISLILLIVGAAASLLYLRLLRGDRT
ncbi:MAG: carbohydrate ABC transporter permease, partial [Candidatus Dormibacteraceae bacterium]